MLRLGTQAHASLQGQPTKLQHFAVCWGAHGSVASMCLSESHGLWKLQHCLKNHKTWPTCSCKPAGAAHQVAVQSLLGAWWYMAAPGTDASVGGMAQTQGSIQVAPHMLSPGKHPHTRLQRQVTKLQQFASLAWYLGTHGTHASVGLEPWLVQASALLHKC